MSSSKLPEGVFYDFVRENEVDEAYAIELEGFPPDEAATLEKMRYRQANAGDLFLGVYLPTRTLIGIIMSTRSSSPVLTHSSMTSHDPKGSSVCVHGICIRKEYRRRGIATDLLREYVQQVSKIQGIERILLLCHEELQRLYVRAGFELVGKSEVVHGSKEWWEMRRILGETGGIDMDGFDVVSEHGGRTASPPSMQAMADIMAAVAQSSSSSRSRPTPKLLSSYPNLQDVIDTDGSETKRNKFKLVCVRDGCGSLILQAETAELVEEPSVEIDPPSTPRSPLLPPLPPPGEKIYWWLVTPSPMAFENIGFSKTVVGEGGRRKKLLACAECDLGPVGWCWEGEGKFYLPLSRVAYRS